MSFTNLDIFGTSNNDLLGAAGAGFGDEYSLPSIGGDLVPSTSTETGVFGNLTDRIFGFGTDLFSGYLNLRGQELLVDEQTRLLQAQTQQSQILGTVEQPTVTGGATLQPWQIAALSGGSGGGSNSIINGIDDKTLLIGAALFAAVILIK